jgi:5'-nucleotidase
MDRLARTTVSAGTLQRGSGWQAVPYELSTRLVIGVASSALFDLTDSDAVFRDGGEQKYREYQEAHLEDPLSPGAAFPFIRRLLSLNDLSEDDGPLVEVIVLSRNDPDTGLRVMRSIDHHELAITRAIFMQGKSPYKFMRPLHMSLFLSENEGDVRDAIDQGLPAGHVQHSTITDDDDDADLRVAFDFDGVLADDESERVFAGGDLADFQAHERLNLTTPHEAGPLKALLAKINVIQRVEEARRLVDKDYPIRLHVAIVTARNAPAHERAIKSLKEWGVTVNDAFFLGGIEKAPILEVLKPHIYFDDQRLHLTAGSVPSVHIPFGVRNVEEETPGDVSSE